MVTGAGRGIGRSIAIALASEGAAVGIAEKNPDEGQATAELVLRAGGDAHAYTVDVSESEEIAGVSTQMFERWGRVDIAVANAGVNVFHEPMEMPDTEWDRCFSVNLSGAWNTAKATLPYMRAQRSGSVIIIASTHSFSIIRDCFPYAVAKHGLVGLARSLGIQYAAEGIRVNAIAPGYIETAAAHAYWSGCPDPEGERKRAEALHPPGRIGRPEEVAMTAVFLASDEAPFINASTITIDGGRSVVYHD